MRILKSRRRPKLVQTAWPYTILWDDREEGEGKHPWHIEHLKFQHEKKRLETGDYTVKGYERQLAIERKSGLKEFIIGISGQNKRRFARFLERLGEVPYACIVIEDRLGNLDKVFAEMEYTQVTPKSVYDWLAKITFEYQIPILFFDGKGHSKQNFLYYLFSVAMETIDKEK